MRHTRIAVAFSAWITCIACLSHVRFSNDENGSQYLAFNGTVSASVTYPSEFDSICKSTTLGPYVNSYLYVGVNPPWDPNPFFFELYHLASESTIPRIGGLTEDAVYNLDFASSAYACWSDAGLPCGFIETQWHYEPEILMNLKSDGGVKVKKTKVGEEDGYEVNGDEKTYLKNETQMATVNGVDVVSGCFKAGVSWRNWIWNETTSWTYTITFSNSSATASIKSTVGGSTMELTYSGDRITNTSYPNIELVMTDDSKPQFRYSNDSEIHFKNSTRGWLVSPNEFPSDSSSTSSTSTRTASSTGGALATGSRTGSAGGPNNTGAAVRVGVSRAIEPLLLLGEFVAFGIGL